MKKLLQILTIVAIVIGIVNAEIINQETLVKEASELHQNGVTNYENGKYKISIDYLKKSILIREEIFGKLHISTARSYCVIGNNYKILGEYKKAKQYIDKSIIIAKNISTNNSTILAQSFNDLGMLYISISKYQKALLYLKKSIEINKKISRSDNLLIAENYNNLGLIYEIYDDYPKALNYYKKSLKITKKIYGDFHKATIIGYISIGSLYTTMGNYQEALLYLKQSIKLGGKLGIDYPGTITSNNNIGLLYIKMNNYPKALEHLHMSLNALKRIIGKENSYVAKNLHNLSLVYEEMNDYKNALKYALESLKITKIILGNNHSDLAMVYSNIGVIYKKEGKYQESLKYYKSALQIDKRYFGDKHSNIAITYSNMSLLYTKIKEYFNAYQYSKKSSDIFLNKLNYNFSVLNNKQKKSYLESKNYIVPFLLNSAYLYGEKDLTYIDDSNIPDWLKGSFDEDNNTTKSKEDKKQKAILNKEKDSKKKSLHQTTLNDWLNYKGAIYDSENTMITLYENTKDQEVKDKIDSLMQSKRKLAGLYQTLPKTKEERSTYKQRIKDKIKEITDIETYIASKASSFKEELGLRTISYKDISKNLKENELYIDYSKAGDYYYIFTLDNKDNITFNQIDKKDTKVIDKNVKEFREDIYTILNGSTKLSSEDLAKLKSSSQKKLSKLYNLALAKPLKDTLSKYSNLIVSTDGALRLLPFETMYNTTTNKYLIEEKNIRYIPSGKELVRLYRQDNKKSQEKIVLFNNPNFDAKDITTLAKVDTLNIPSTNQNRAGIIKSLFKMRFVALPGTQEEVKNIKETLNAKNIQEYAQNDAKEENLLKVNKPKILHIATHGFFINDDNIPNPMLKSGIALSGANASAIRGNSDGIVTSLKLSGLNLKGTELVVLSACQTGVVDIKSTDNVSGLNKAFIQAGAQNIVMSLWSVADKETSELMSGFYKEMKNTPDYAEALKNSKLKMIKQDLHPFYWGAFVLSGR